MTNFKIIFTAEKDVLASPEIPKGKLGILCVRGNSTVLVRYRQKVAYRVRQNVVKGSLPRVLVDGDGTAHHFSKVFAAPAAIFAVGLFPKDGNEFAPKRRIAQMLLLQKEGGLMRDTRKTDEIGLFTHRTSSLSKEETPQQCIMVRKSDSS